MNIQTLEERIRFDIEFALRQYKYKPPHRFDKDPSVRERYYKSAASAVYDQLKLSYEITAKPFDQFGGCKS